MVSAAHQQIIGGGGAPINKSRRPRRPQIVGLHVRTAIAPSLLVAEFHCIKEVGLIEESYKI